MGKVSKANTYFLIIMLLQLFLPVSKIFEIFNITDIKLMLFINHSIIFIIPAIIYLIITKQSIRGTLKLNKLYLIDRITCVYLSAYYDFFFINITIFL